MSDTAPTPDPHFDRSRKTWLRPPILRVMDQEGRSATWLELFFDLCFVASVASLGAVLHADPTWQGALRFAALFVPVWWGWMGFTWYATAFDTDDVVYRLSLLAAMLAILALAVSVGRMRDGDTTGFVVSYVVLQAILVSLLLRARQHAHETRNFTTWYAGGYAVGGLIWLASLAVPTPGQYWVWVIAMAVLMTTPMLAVRTYEGQPFDSSHIPERYGLFTIIVLGESVIAVAAATAGTGWAFASGLTAAAGFGIAACIWWVYFDFVEATALRRDDMVRAFVWGYGHLGVYVGIAATAVGIQFAIDAVAEQHALSSVERATFLGGAALYLLAIALIHFVTVASFDEVLAVRLAGAAAIAVLGAASPWLSAMAIVLIAFALLASHTAYEVVRAGPLDRAPPVSERH